MDTDLRKLVEDAKEKSIERALYLRELELQYRQAKRISQLVDIICGNCGESVSHLPEYAPYLCPVCDSYAGIHPADGSENGRH